MSKFYWRTRRAIGVAVVRAGLRITFGGSGKYTNVTIKRVTGEEE